MGSFNLAGPRLTWAEFIALLGVPNPVWVPAEILEAQGVSETELPLYRPNGGRRSNLMHVSNTRAVEAGLKVTGPESTVEAVRNWLRQCDLTPALSAEREAALIRLARTGQSP
jgi:2'-hydroxyisoflavone reductase